MLVVNRVVQPIGMLGISGININANIHQKPVTYHLLLGKMPVVGVKFHILELNYRHKFQV